MSSWFRRTPESERLLAQERVVLGATELLSEALERRGRSRSELAAALGVSPSEVTQRFSGKRNLSLRSLADMLHALNFGVEARLVDMSEHRSSVPVHAKRLAWPNEAAYQTRTGVPVRLVKTEPLAS
jgi:transcriptional regulator with XRE-family HTH domain